LIEIINQIEDKFNEMVVMEIDVVCSALNNGMDRGRVPGAMAAAGAEREAEPASARTAKLRVMVAGNS
jgi:hypothetical protein